MAEKSRNLKREGRVVRNLKAAHSKIFQLVLPVALLLFVLFGISRTAWCDVKWDDCVQCHGKQEEGLPPVDIEGLQHSVHKDLKCLDCHADIHEMKHAVSEVPHQFRAGSVNCTERCHTKGNAVGAPDSSPMEQYRDSVHGRARGLGLQDAATCADCHGRHKILPKDDPESTVYRANIPRTCAVCHADMQVVVKHHIHAEKPFQEYEQSVHGRALYADGLIDVAAVCTDCHGVHNIQAAGATNLQPRRPETCGACHIAILESYKRSVHGVALFEEKNQDAPTCADCHGEHGIGIPDQAAIASICSKCHAEEGIMSKYSIPIDRSATYKQSYHGIASSYGSITVANCASCHGFHDILPASDPKSSINPNNLVATCGKPACHPGISAKVSSAKIHVDVTNEEAGGVYYVRRVFVWMFVGLLIITFIWVVPDIARRLRGGSED